MNNTIRCLCIFLLTVALMGGCASSTTLKSLPEGARVYSAQGALLGVSPYTHWDRNISYAEQMFVLVAEDYKRREILIKKDCLYIHRLFMPPVLALPWLMGYDVEYTFELEKLPTSNAENNI